MFVDAVQYYFDKLVYKSKNSSRINEISHKIGNHNQQLRQKDLGGRVLSTAWKVVILSKFKIVSEYKFIFSPYDCFAWW